MGGVGNFLSQPKGLKILPQRENWRAEHRKLNHPSQSLKNYLFKHAYKYYFYFKRMSEKGRKAKEGAWSCRNYRGPFGPQ